MTGCGERERRGRSLTVDGRQEIEAQDTDGLDL